MELLSLTTERVVALVVAAAQVIAAVAFAKVSPNRGILAASALGLTLPGLLLIWFREGLSATAFDRGVMRESPPFLVDLFGWLFLIGLPVIFLYLLLP
jgi:hypothetical protein